MGTLIFCAHCAESYPSLSREEMIRAYIKCPHLVFSECNHLDVPVCMLTRITLNYNYIIYSLSLAAGTAGPAFYGLGIRDSLLVILAVDIMWVPSDHVRERFCDHRFRELAHAPYQRICK